MEVGQTPPTAAVPPVSPAAKLSGVVSGLVAGLSGGAPAAAPVAAAPAFNPKADRVAELEKLLADPATKPVVREHLTSELATLQGGRIPAATLSSFANQLADKMRGGPTKADLMKQKSTIAKMVAGAAAQPTPPSTDFQKPTPVPRIPAQ